MSSWDLFAEVNSILTEMGGKGSGHHGHKGIKGRRGGSAPSGGKKLPPTNSTVRMNETLFSKAEANRVKKAVSVLPQDHCDAVNIVYQDFIGEGYAGECNKYGVVTMGTWRDGKANWSGGDVVHEVGHAVLFYNNRVEPAGLGIGKHGKQFRQFYKAKAKESGLSLMGLERKAASRETRGKALKGFPTAYSMVDFHELFAESYQLYVKSPKTLQKRSPDVYGYLRDEVFGGVEYTK